MDDSYLPISSKIPTDEEVALEQGLSDSEPDEEDDEEEEDDDE